MRSHLAPLPTLGAMLLAASLHAAEVPQQPAFEADVRPLLKASCFHCHGEEEEPEGGLDVRLVRLLSQGGDSGPAIVPGDRKASLLFQRVRDKEMPPDPSHALTPEQVETIGRWIDAGAKTLRPEPEDANQYVITEEERAHWAWQPIGRPTPPAVKHIDRVRTPIDRFLLAKLEEHGFSFSPDADRGTLLRRMYLDLLGLPPTPEQAEAFLSNDSPQAVDQLFEELLASPHYGERWGRHWLDVAGYADSEGYSAQDAERRWAWKYRDYVIQSFNDDLPFDQFIREQLAGDEMISSPLNNLTPEDARKLAATGFLRMAPDGTGGAVDDPALARNDVVAGTIQIVSSALMGVTLGCAQCHDHRYDPIPQSDYYAFRAIFEPGLSPAKWRTPAQRLVSLYTDADRAEAARIEEEAKAIDAERSAKQQKYIDATFEKQVETLPEEEREAARAAFTTAAKDRTDEQKALFKKYPKLNVTAGSLYLYDRKAADELKEMAAEAAKIRESKPEQQFVHAFTEQPGQIPATHLFYRGAHEQPRQELLPDDLMVVSLTAGEAAFPKDDDKLPTSGRRTALAERLTDPRHPLTARVIVNRIWMHHFGRGLVPTPADFGTLGTPPTHPELLDWLASEFITSGWSVKHMHRLILGSTAARQALRTDPRQDVVDPDNDLYGGARLKRLEAEAVRDRVLAASGQLQLKPFGPPIPVMADQVGRWVIGIENLDAGRPGAVLPMHGEDFRRSVYVQVRRSRPLAVLDTFDSPRMEPNCDFRRASTATPQSLMLMNSDFIVERSRDFAARVTAVSSDPGQQIETAWQLAYVRKPTDSERASALTFLETQTAAFTEKAAGKQGKDKPLPPEQQALATLCQMLLSSNEFLYVD